MIILGYDLAIIIAAMRLLAKLVDHDVALRCLS